MVSHMLQHAASLWHDFKETATCQSPSRGPGRLRHDVLWAVGQPSVVGQHVRVDRASNVRRLRRAEPTCVRRHVLVGQRHAGVSNKYQHDSLVLFCSNVCFDRFDLQCCDTASIVSGNLLECDREKSSLGPTTATHNTGKIFSSSPVWHLRAVQELDVAFSQWVTESAIPDW